MATVSYILAQGYRTVSTEEQFELARWSTGNALLIGGIVTLVGAYLVVWLYRHEGRGRMSRRLRGALTALRLAALVMIGVIALEPVFVRYEERRQDATTLLLVDTSASMGIADRYRNEMDRQVVRDALGALPEGGLTRADICERLLNDDQRGIVRRLAQRNRVKVLGFDRAAVDFAEIERDDVQADEKPPGPPPIEIDPRGTATDLGVGVRRAIESASGAPIAGVVVMTDGRANRGESFAQIGRALKQRNSPIYVVGVGDPAPPVNLRVAELSAPKSAFKNDPFRISAKIESRGLAGESVRAELWERRAGEAVARRVGEQVVQIAADGETAPVVFERKVETPGTMGYALRLPQMDGEAVVQDNERDLVPGVRILDDKMKVLLVSGGPSLDYRFLSRLLERDATVELSTWLQSADINAVRDGNVVLTELPVGTDQINKYDAVLLMDVDPRELDPTWGSVLATYVTDYGGGVLYAADNKYTGEFFRSPKTKPIVAILPIVPDPEAEIIINELGHFQTQAWPIVVPVEAAGDPILQLTDRVDETRDVWAFLGGVYWHYPVRREKPVAKRLMEHSNPRMVNAYGPHVLFATQYVGTGRSAYLGINSTRMWRRGDERPFNRFWIQTLRFLVEGKLLGGRARGQIMTGQDAYEIGDTIVVDARVLTERFEPLLLPELNMTVQPMADGAQAATAIDVALAPIAGQDGHYQGRFQARDAGTLKLRIRLSSSADGADDAAAIEKEVLVAEPNLELRETSLDESSLRGLAEGAGAGSRYLSIAEAFELPNLIEDFSRTTRHRGRVRPAWDQSIVFAGLILLLTAEWILRKVAKLI